MKFSDLGLVEPLLRAVAAQGYMIATPVQAEAIPHVLAGKDVLGSAQTGTGKTAAFALPILQRLSAHANVPSRLPRCPALCPTRELAHQIAADFRAYGKFMSFHVATIFGGVSQHAQVDHLRKGVPIIVATPGRLLDLMEQGYADLRGIEVLVLDEADRMLDMGFINDIRKIVARISDRRQTLLFSATMPKEIRQLANSLLRDPVTVQVAPVATTAARISEGVYFVEKRNKPTLLAHLVESLPMTRAIVFTRTKHGADRVVRHLHIRGIKAEAIHGNKSQNARQRALDNFKANKIPVLVATDIASRGIDIDDITHVVNYDLTHEPETYVHRIGRTARAGASASAISFCDRDEMSNLKAIERLIKRPVPVCSDHPEYPAESATKPAHREHAPQRGESQQSGHREHAPRHPASPSGHREHAPRHPAAPSGRREHAPRHPASQSGHREYAPRQPAAQPAHREHSPRHPAAPWHSARPHPAAAPKGGRPHPTKSSAKHPLVHPHAARPHPAHRQNPAHRGGSSGRRHSGR